MSVSDLIERTAVSKMLFFTLVQPPNSSSMVNNFGFWKRIFILRHLSVARTVVVFRGNFLTFWRVEIISGAGFRHLFSTFFSTTLSTTDTVGSARIDSLGVTVSNLSLPVDSLPAELRFPSNQYIANSALDKSVSRGPRARIQNFDVFIQCPNRSCAFA